MILTQLIQRAALLKPNQVATICQDRQKTWAESVERVARLAGAFRDLGIAPGDRIAILSLNSDRYFEYYYAVPWAGGVTMPMNTRWADAESDFVLKDAAPKLLIVDDAFADYGMSVLKRGGVVEQVIFAGDGPIPDGMPGFETMIEQSSPVEDIRRGYEDLAGIYYTGGTTGFPKGVMLSHRNLWSSGIINVTALQDIPSDGAHLHIAPMFHLADMMRVTSMTMTCHRHVFLPKFDPQTVLETIADHRVSHTFMVPTMLTMLLEHPGFDQYDLSTLVNIEYGGAPMPLSLLRKAFAMLPDIQFQQGYGQTELAPMVSMLAPQDHDPDGDNAHRLKSVGKPCVGIFVKIVDESLQEVTCGEVGQLAVSSPGAMKGYWGNQEQTDRTLVDGWVLTGDAGYMDQDGYLYLVDRVKDMIISGGENVFSAEVEKAVSDHPAVIEVAVIGEPHKKWGESVHAIIRLEEGSSVTSQEIIEHCRKQIAGYKCPRHVTFRKQHFPLTGVGKIKKDELRKMYFGMS